MIWLVLVRIALCAAVTWACYYVLTFLFKEQPAAVLPVTIAVSCPIWAVALARPIVEFFPAVYEVLRRLVWGGEQGRWYEYDGQHIRVFTVDAAPWVAVQDIAAVTGWKNLDERCRQLPPEQCQVVEGSDLVCLSEAGIHTLFANRTDQQALKFGLWIERNVLLQFRLARERGMRLPRT